MAMASKTKSTPFSRGLFSDKDLSNLSIFG